MLYTQMMLKKKKPRQISSLSLKSNDSCLFEWKIRNFCGVNYKINGVIFLSFSKRHIWPWYILFFRPSRSRFLIRYLYSITVRSAAPQTALSGGPGPRFKPGTGSLYCRSRKTTYHTSLNHHSSWYTVEIVVVS